jgi:hypothetical protein
MIAVIVWLTFGALACGGMSALGLWLNRDHARQVAGEALAAHLSYLYGEAEALRAELWEATCNCHDQWNLDYIQGELDGIMVEIINITNSTTGGN